MTMIEKNDPHQEKVKLDNSDDELIIELTDEIETKSEDDAFIESDHQVQDDQDKFGEEDINVSAIEETIEADDDERISLNGAFDIDSEEDDDVIILDEEKDTLKADTAESVRDEAVFDLEEEIKLERESDEDELEFFTLDDENTEEDDDRLDLLKDLELKFEEEDEMIAPVTDGEKESESDRLESKETPDFENAGDLPGLIAEMEFELDDDDDANGIDPLEAHEAEDDGDIIAEALEQSEASDEDSNRIEWFEEGKIESLDDGEIVALDDAQDEGADTFALLQDEMPDLDSDEDLFNFDGDINLEPDDEITSLDESENITVEEEEDIIKITEFDQHYPEKDEKLLEPAGVLDTSESENEEFIELLEVEEDDRAKDEELLASDEGEDEVADAETGGFLSESLEMETGLEDELAEPFEDTYVLDPDDQKRLAPGEDEDEVADAETGGFLSESLEVETGLDDDLSEPGEDTFALDPDVAMTAAALTSGAQKLDLDSDSEEITQEVEELDTFLREDSTAEHEETTIAADQSEKDEPVQEDLQEIPDTDELPAVSPELITAAVESVINEKFAGKIENIIYEVIEKAVSKEIDRLKGVLFENSSSNNNR
jgi:hypothetical protein